MNLLLHGIEDFKIVKEDTLRNPAFFNGDKLAQFDCVIANPPFSLENWGEETWASDPYGRNALGGIPPRKNADWAWVQHMYKSMANLDGRAAVVLPQGAFSRSGNETKLRKAFLENDLIEAVIGLGANLFYGTPLAPCILVLRSNKVQAKKEKVLFVNAEKFVKRGRNQNTLEHEHVDQIFSAFKNFQDVPGFARIVHTQEIVDKNFDLSVSLYVAPLSESASRDFGELLRSLESGIASLSLAKENLDKELCKWGYCE
jgi:type I restriction-modification system DNA methylase subunit